MSHELRSIKYVAGMKYLLNTVQHSPIGDLWKKVCEIGYVK